MTYNFIYYSPWRPSFATRSYIHKHETLIIKEQNWDEVPMNLMKFSCELKLVYSIEPATV